MSHLLEAEAVTVKLGGHTVLEGISLVVQEGEKVGLAGPNGAGKSTLLWCLLGLLKPAEGKVRRRGKAVAVFQNPEDQLFMPTLEEDLMLPLINRGASRGEAQQQVEPLLTRMRLARYARQPAGNLSLGLRKRAAIAAALVQEPDLLVLDEPTSELDPRSARELTATLGELSCALLIASHHLELLGKVTERLLVLDEGRLVAEGKSLAILADADLLARHGLM